MIDDEVVLSAHVGRALTATNRIALATMLGAINYSIPSDFSPRLRLSRSCEMRVLHTSYPPQEGLEQLRDVAASGVNKYTLPLNHA